MVEPFAASTVHVDSPDEVPPVDEGPIAHKRVCGAVEVHLRRGVDLLASEFRSPVRRKRVAKSPATLKRFTKWADQMSD